jgi:hypothetical protein
VDLVDADRCRQVDLGVPQVELEVLAVLRQARVVRAGAVCGDLSRGHPCGVFAPRATFATAHRKRKLRHERGVYVLARRCVTGLSFSRQGTTSGRHPTTRVSFPKIRGPANSAGGMVGSVRR